MSLCNKLLLTTMTTSIHSTKQLFSESTTNTQTSTKLWPIMAYVTRGVQYIPADYSSSEYVDVITVLYLI